MKELFKLDGNPSSKATELIIQISGIIFLFALWIGLTESGTLSPLILPSPFDVLKSYETLHFDDALVANTWYSVKLNFYGYLEAIAIAIPLGFLIGLFPFFRNLLRKYVDAIRFIPLTAVTGLFIGWFGIYTPMKIHFLSFGIIVYLLPVVIQRISEVETVHKQTVWTLGASSWQSFKSVYFPSVMSKVFDDIRVIVAISWTYIIVAEMVNNTGGVGSMIFIAAKQTRIDKVFAILLVIILIGFIQDKLFKWMDRKLFPHKYV